MHASRKFKVAASFTSILNASRPTQPTQCALLTQARWSTAATASRYNVTHPDPPSSATINDTILKKHNQYTLNTYSRPALIFTHGKGCLLYDTEGREYLDLTAGIAVNALGHGDEQLANVMHEQAKKLVHLSNLFFNEHAGELAKELVENTRNGGGFAATRVFLANSGTEANEGAFKFARKWGKVAAPEGSPLHGRKHKVLSFSNAFHGRSMGALSATPNPKYQKPFSPMVPGFTFTTYNDMTALENNIDEETCAVIVEPIQGEGGVWEASEDFLRALRKRCDETGALLIFDEIQCGLGRTGKLWAHQHYSSDCHPDILTMAKPLANGFPIGAIMISERLEKIIGVGDHGTTFGGNPLGCRVALSVLERINKPEFLEHVTEMGTFLRARLLELQRSHSSLITEIRGKGLIQGIQFTQDPTPLIKLTREQGLLILTAGCNTVRIVPPLIIKKDQIEKGIDLLDSSIQEMKRIG